jgi:pyruvate dehydrogenase E1 component
LVGCCWQSLSSSAVIVTAIDGSPGALSWIGAVRGHRVSGLGLDRFGQTGDLPDLYSAYRLDSDAMIDAMAGLFLD